MEAKQLVIEIRETPQYIFQNLLVAVTKLLFSAEIFFPKEVIQFSFQLSFLVLKLPITRKFFCRAVSNWNTTNVWASGWLEVLGGGFEFRRPHLISMLFLILLNPIFFNNKKLCFFRQNSSFFDMWALFFSKLFKFLV